MLSKNEIKNLRALHQKKYRDLENSMLVEGERLIQDLVERHAQYVQRIFISKRLNSVLDNWKLPNSFSFPIVEVDDHTIEQLSNAKGPQGIVAQIQAPKQRFQEQDFTVVLDTIQDPGNFGTILRTMAWFGIKQLVCSENTVDFCNPKVVQSSMGTVYDIDVQYCDLSTYLSTQNKSIYGALLEGESLFNAALETPAILIMGNEGNGISEEVKKRISHPVSIPKYGVGESLNVASATSIFLGAFASRGL